MLYTSKVEVGQPDKSSLVVIKWLATIDTKLSANLFVFVFVVTQNTKYTQIHISSFREFRLDSIAISLLVDRLSLSK